MTYAGAVFHGQGDIRIESKEDKAPGPREVKLRVRACGVCGTDIHIVHGSPGSAEAAPPVVLGHELSGEVTEVGREVEALRPGDHISVDPNITCGHCFYCRKGNAHLCRDLTAVGVNYDGGFAEYARVPASHAYKAYGSASYGESALAEPLACCLHGIDRAGIRAGQTVAVVGAGAIGLMMVQLAFLQGASRVLVGEPVARRRELAEEFGAEAADPRGGGFLQWIRDCTAEGVDVAIEAAGRPEAMSLAIASARRGGTVLLFSVPELSAQLEVEPYQIFFRELTILGSFINPATQGRAVDLISRGKVQLEPLITHRFPLKEIGRAFETHGKPEAIKILVEP